MKNYTDLIKKNHSDVLTHCDVKRIYRYCLLRECLYSINTSGLYSKDCVYLAAKASGINYTTFRTTDIQWFIRMGFIEKHGDVLALKKLEGKFRKLFNLFKGNQHELKKQKSPSQYFADLYKRNVISHHVKVQIKCEGQKFEDRNARKLKKLVNSQKAFVGETLGVNMSVSTIGNLFGLGKTSGHNYVERLHSQGIIKRRRNFHVLGFSSEIGKFRKNDELYGRLMIKDGLVVQRLQNSYMF